LKQKIIEFFFFFLLEFFELIGIDGNQFGLKGLMGGDGIYGD